jgi:zinc D-Ala-D-Ala dipeptidase
MPRMLTPEQTADGFALDPEMPADFVYLRDIDPSILQDIRYASANNFTGRIVPGYEAPECVLLGPVAEALRRVQADMKSKCLSLKVYDGYRPHRAVRAFATWANNGTENEFTRSFYPRIINKSELLEARYISSSSLHSCGIAVDVTLVELPTRLQHEFDLARLVGPCIGPVGQRIPDNSVDMGTGFDCFDVKSHTSNNEITDEQQRWRCLLAAAMERHRFKNYWREWWHFTYQMPEDTVLKEHDFPILPRSRSSPQDG